MVQGFKDITESEMKTHPNINNLMGKYYGLTIAISSIQGKEGLRYLEFTDSKGETYCEAHLTREYDEILSK